MGVGVAIEGPGVGVEAQPGGQGRCGNATDHLGCEGQRVLIWVGEGVWRQSETLDPCGAPLLIGDRAYHRRAAGDQHQRGRGLPATGAIAHLHRKNTAALTAVLKEFQPARIDVGLGEAVGYRGIRFGAEPQGFLIATDGSTSIGIEPERATGG